MELIYHNRVLKYLSRQDSSSQQRIYAALEGLKAWPPIGDIRKLKGTSGTFRLRIGSIRVIFVPNHADRTVYIQVIENRGEVYK